VSSVFTSLIITTDLYKAHIFAALPNNKTHGHFVAYLGTSVDLMAYDLRKSRKQSAKSVDAQNDASLQSRPNGM
jgi:hypothetical protein